MATTRREKTLRDEYERTIAINSISACQSTLNRLPHEIFENILYQIGTLQQIFRLQIVCKHWKNVIDSLQLWKPCLDLGYLLIDDPGRLRVLQKLVSRGLGSGSHSNTLKVVSVSLCHPLASISNGGDRQFIALSRRDLYTDFLSKNKLRPHTIGEARAPELYRFGKANADVRFDYLLARRNDLTARKSHFCNRIDNVTTFPWVKTSRDVIMVGTAAQKLSMSTILSQICRTETLQIDDGMPNVLLFLCYLSEVSNPVQTLRLSTRYSTFSEYTPYAGLLEDGCELTLGTILYLEMENINLNQGPSQASAGHKIAAPCLYSFTVKSGSVDTVLLHSAASSLKVLELQTSSSDCDAVLQAILELKKIEVLSIQQDPLTFSEALSKGNGAGGFPCPLLDRVSLHGSRSYLPKANLTMNALLQRLVKAFSRRLHLKLLYARSTQEDVPKPAAVRLRKFDTLFYSRLKWTKREWNRTFERFLILFPDSALAVRERASDRETEIFFDKRIRHLADRGLEAYFREF